MSAMNRFVASTAVGLVVTGVGVLPATSVEASTPVVNARINARWGSVVDSAGNTWAGRSGFAGPVNRSDGLAGREIAGTTDDILYQSNVWGMTSFNRAVPNGSYQVRLLMAEDYHALAGKRVFNVTSEGAPALTGVDIIGAVGARATAYERTFTTRVTDGSLDLGFVALADKPLVSAIEIISVPDPGSVVKPPSPSDATTSTGGTAATVETLATTPDVSGGGQRPTLVNGLLTSVAGGGDSRSEVFWGTSTAGRYRLARGTTVTAEFAVRHRFSNPATGALPSTATWHTIYQLHGPTMKNTWPSPPLTIAWQNGTYRVGGGSSVPTSTGTMVNQGSWYMPYAAAPENVWRTLKVTTYLDGPGRGWVSIWIDGQPYLQRWMPTAGTMYTDAGAYSHQEISIKSGLYTGTQSPTWNRWVEQRGMKITVSTPTRTQTAVVS